jgi:hypothetical protein
MSEIEDAINLLTEFMDINGDQAGRLAQASATLHQTKARAAFIYGEGSQEVGRIEQGISYVTVAQSQIAELGAHVETSAIGYLSELIS